MHTLHGGSPALFWKSKKVLRFWKKGPNCVHPWIKSSLQNVVLRVSSRKRKLQSFSLRAFLCCVVDKMFIEVPYFHKNFPALKNLWLRACSLGVYGQKDSRISCRFHLRTSKSPAFPNPLMIESFCCLTL